MEQPGYLWMELDATAKYPDDATHGKQAQLVEVEVMARLYNDSDHPVLVAMPTVVLATGLQKPTQGRKRDSGAWVNAPDLAGSWVRLTACGQLLAKLTLRRVYEGGLDTYKQFKDGPCPFPLSLQAIGRFNGESFTIEERWDPEPEHIPF